MNKKVLLRECKRHTACRVASTPYVVLTGYPPGRVPPLARVPPSQSTPRPGYPPPGYPPSQGTTRLGTPPARVPPGLGTPLAWVPPQAGYPPGQGTPLAGPGRVPPQLPHGILGNVAKHYGIWVPPPRGQTNKVKVLPSRRTTYAGGNNITYKRNLAKKIDFFSTN